MKVLVTGAAGFIGSHIVDALRTEGHEVVGIDNLSSGVRTNLPADVVLHEVDIRDPAAAEVIGAFAPDVLCHHAAQIDVRKSVQDPANDADVNVAGTLRVLEACRRSGCRRVVFASTGGAIYGEQDVFPATEDHPQRPMSPYGCAKRSVEVYLDYYAREYGFATTSLRYANVYGPRQNAHGEAGVVAIFAGQLLTGAPTMIFGDGGQTRDFVHVADIAAANLAAIGHELRGAYNVGTGVEVSVYELYEKMRAIVGGAPPVYRPARPGEQRRSCIDASRLRAATGWEPRVALDVGLASTIESLRR
ncbi:MAG: NAD-dependent epimerase/dehydratase family protein [Kofleriaceae bacterium]